MKTKQAYTLQRPCSDQFGAGGSDGEDGKRGEWLHEQTRFDAF